MGNRDTQRKFYTFLRDRWQDQKPFTKQDALAATGWKPKSWGTYVSKQVKAYLRKLPDKKLRVKRSFGRFGTFEAFQPLVTQVKHSDTKYKRKTFDAVVTYEFLLPLTQEGKLRLALDELFYTDTLDALVRDLADDELLETAYPAEEGESTENHIQRAIKKIAELFGGYSISHVSGRFRAAQIASRVDAARQLIANQRYLVDETTAVVRFIIPCTCSERTHGARFKLAEGLDVESLRTVAVQAEIRVIRGLFFAVFLEAIVRTVQGEDLIWLLEDSPFGRRLYELGKTEESGGDAGQEQNSEDSEDSEDSEP